MSYAIGVLGEGSQVLAVITKTLNKAVAEVFVTYADKLRAEGGLMATARALLRVLDHRTGPVPAFVRERVLATTDEQLLERWFDRALSAPSIEEVFQPLDA